MKKKLIAFAVAFCAAGLNAASFTWTSGSYRLVDTDGTTKLTAVSGGTIGLYLLGTAADYSDATWLQDGAVVDSGKSKGQVYGTYSFVYDKETPANNSIKTGDVLAVLFKDTDGNLYNLKAADGTTDMVETYRVDGLSEDIWSGADFAFATSNFQATAAAVPEPTSGLLLLLGMGALALRRKRA